MCETLHRQTKRFSAFLQACALLPAGIALLTVTGWASGRLFITQLGSDYIPMAPSTALAFFLLGGGLLIHVRWPAHRLGHRFAAAAAVFASSLASWLLAQYLSGSNLDIESLLIEAPESLGGVLVGRMSPVTAAAFVLAGLALLILVSAPAAWRVGPTVAASLALGVTAIGLVATLGYVYGTPLLYGGPMIPVALTTALAFLPLGLGLLAAAGPQAWPLRTVLGRSMRARLLRAFLPTILLVVVGEGWLETVLLSRSGGNPALTVSLAALVCLAVTSGVIVLIARNIGDAIEQAEEKTHLMEAELAHAARLSTLGAMTAGIAHELNQPLSLALYFSQCCQELLSPGQVPDLGRLRESIDEIASAATRAGSIVSQLRSFARKAKSSPSPCSINEIAEEAVRLATLEARRHQATVALELATPSPQVNVDRVRIDQVLVNLLRNAFEAMDDERVATRRATLGTRIDGDFVEVSVADTGPGLPPDMGSKVFHAFVSTKADGMGMGLAVSRTIVETHGGKLWSTSNPQGGATFCLTLPLLKQGEPPALHVDQPQTLSAKVLP